MSRFFARSHAFARPAANDFALRHEVDCFIDRIGRLKLMLPDGLQGFFQAGKRSRRRGRRFHADAGEKHILKPLCGSFWSWFQFNSQLEHLFV